MRLRLKAMWWVIGSIVALAPYAVFLVPNDRVIDGGDYKNSQLAMREQARRDIRAGRLPLWNSYVACGAPVHAGQQLGLAYLPVTAAVVLLSANGGLKLSVFLHIAWCYWGQYRLCRLFGITRPASSFAAIVTCNSGFVVFHLLEGHTNLVFVYAWVPWFFWALVKMMRGPSARNAVVLALVTVPLMIAGHPQVFYYCMLLGGAWAVGSMVSGAAEGHRRAFVGWAGCAALVAVLLASIQLVPTLELVRDGYGAGERGTMEFASEHAASILDCLTFWWPTYMGGRHAGTGEFPYVKGFVHERTNYLGVAVPLLVLVGLAKRGGGQTPFSRQRLFAGRRAMARKRSQTPARWQWAVVGLIALCFLIALGPNTPLFGWVGPWIPGMLTFRCPARTLAIVAVLAPLLAGRGLDSLLENVPWKHGSGLFGAIAIGLVSLAVTLVSVWVLFDLGPRYFAFVKQNVSQELVTCGVLTLVGLIVVGALPSVGRKSKTAAYGLAIWFIANDLWFTNGQHIRLAAPVEVQTMAGESQGDPSVRIVEASSFPEITETELRYSSLVPVLIQNGWTSVVTNEGGVRPQSTSRLNSAIIHNTLPALAAASVNWIWGRGGWRPLEDALPRARFIPAESSELCAVPIEGITADQVEQLRNKALQCRIEVDHGSRLSVLVEAPTNGMFVLADTYYPGWTCRSEDAELAIVPVHGVFRGVSLSAGTHRLVFEYRPSSFRIGLALSIVGLLLAGGLAWYGYCVKGGSHFQTPSQNASPGPSPLAGRGVMKRF